MASCCQEKCVWIRQGPKTSVLVSEGADTNKHASKVPVKGLHAEQYRYLLCMEGGSCPLVLLHGQEGFSYGYMC